MVTFYNSLFDECSVVYMTIAVLFLTDAMGGRGVMAAHLGGRGAVWEGGVKGG